MNDLDLLDVAARLYDPAQAAFWDHIFVDENCYCAIKYIDGGSVLVFRGSVSVFDWFNDLTEDPIEDHQLGAVHGGFYRGVRDKYQSVMAALKGETTVVGHSLGAARAMLFGGLMLANGPPPRAIRAWGCPRPGFSRLSEIVATCPDARWYRNQSDPVTFVPWRLGDFKHCGEMRQVHATPIDGDEWGPLRDHHLSQYRAGMIAAEAVPVG